MRRSFTFVLVGACALGGALLFPSTSHAQRMVPGEDAWYYSLPGAHIPFQGMPVSERIGYPPTPTFLWGDARRQFWTAYEIDHEDRLAAFGTRYTPEHPPLFNRILDRWHRRDHE
jgi:hypothetical protein